MNNYLITGCGGFIGSHLAEFLLTEAKAVFGMVHRDSSRIEHLKGKLAILSCDLLDQDRVMEIVTEVQPDCIFHLAAQSIISSSWQNPESTLMVNILGTLYLLEAVRKAGRDPVVVVTGSSSQYGLNNEDGTLIKENKEFYPSSPYGASKIAEEALAYAYFRSYQTKTILVRPFYVTGPRKDADACSDFARGIVRIERGQQKALMVGNLEAIRDVVDVRDAVKALTLLAEKGVAGEAYNLCSGTGYKMRDILDKFISLASTKIEVHQDPSKMRPADDPILVGDNSKLLRLGWTPQITIDRTLADILDYWRGNKCL